MNELKIKLCEDISSFFKKDRDLVLKNTDRSLFCNPFYLTPEEILYLYFHLKKNYKLSDAEDKIKEGSFQCIDSICYLLSS